MLTHWLSWLLASSSHERRAELFELRSPATILARIGAVSIKEPSSSHGWSELAGRLAGERASDRTNEANGSESVYVPVERPVDTSAPSPVCWPTLRSLTCLLGRRWLLMAPSMLEMVLAAARSKRMKLRRSLLLLCTLCAAFAGDLSTSISRRKKRHAHRPTAEETGAARPLQLKQPTTAAAAVMDGCRQPARQRKQTTVEVIAVAAAVTTTPTAPEWNISTVPAAGRLEPSRFLCGRQSAGNSEQ